MKIIFLFALLFAASTATARGQAPAAKPAKAADESKILQLEQDWMGAMKRRDEATLNRLLAPEFTLSGIAIFNDGPERPPVPRETWMENTLHNLKVESFSFDKTRVRVFGDTATVQAVFTWKGVFQNERFTDTVVLIDTWIRRSGHWQVVSRLIGEGEKPASR